MAIDDLAFALAAYRADRGTYPAKLAELVPKYVKTVPTDIFNNDADLHYSRQNKGYLLYSVGPNGQDNDGKGYNDRKEGEDWDDITVRIPANFRTQPPSHEDTKKTASCLCAFVVDPLLHREAQGLDQWKEKPAGSDG